MTVMQAMGKPGTTMAAAVSAPRGARLLGGLAGQSRALKRRLAEMLMRGDRDYAMLSALSQEIGRMRQRIRADLQRRRDERKRRKAARTATPGTLQARRRKGHEP